MTDNYIPVKLVHSLGLVNTLLLTRCLCLIIPGVRHCNTLLNFYFYLILKHLQCFETVCWVLHPACKNMALVVSKFAFEISVVVVYIFKIYYRLPFLYYKLDFTVYLLCFSCFLLFTYIILCNTGVIVTCLLKAAWLSEGEACAKMAVKTITTCILTWVKKLTNKQQRNTYSVQNWSLKNVTVTVTVTSLPADLLHPCCVNSNVPIKLAVAGMA